MRSATASAARDALGIQSGATYSTVAEMVAADVTNITSGQTVTLTGYYATGDFGEPLQLIVEASTGGVKSHTLADGRYANLYVEGNIHASWFGVKADYGDLTTGTDDTVALQEAIDACLPLDGGNDSKSTLILPPGRIRITQPIITSYITANASGTEVNIADASVSALSLSSATGAHTQSYKTSLTIKGTTDPERILSGSEIVGDFTASSPFNIINVLSTFGFNLENVVLRSNKSDFVLASVADSIGLAVYSGASSLTVENCAILYLNEGVSLGNPSFLIDLACDFPRLKNTAIRCYDGVVSRVKNAYGCQLYGCNLTVGRHGIHQRVKDIGATSDNFDPIIQMIGGSILIEEDWTNTLVYGTIDSVSADGQTLTVSSLTKINTYDDTPVAATISDIVEDMVAVCVANQPAATAQQTTQRSASGIVSSASGTDVVLKSPYAFDSGITSESAFFSTIRSFISGGGIVLRGVHLEMGATVQGGWSPMIAYMDNFRKQSVLEDCEVQLLAKTDQGDFNFARPLVMLRANRTGGAQDEFNQLIVRGGYWNANFVKLQIGDDCFVRIEDTVFKSNPTFVDDKGYRPKEDKLVCRYSVATANNTSVQTDALTSPRSILKRDMVFSDPDGYLVEMETPRYSDYSLLSGSDGQEVLVRDKRLKFPSTPVGVNDPRPITGYTVTSDKATNAYRFVVTAASGGRDGLYEGRIITIRGADTAGADLTTTIRDLYRYGAIEYMIVEDAIVTDVTDAEIIQAEFYPTIYSDTYGVGTSGYSIHANDTDEIQFSGLTTADFNNSTAFSIRGRFMASDLTGTNSLYFFATATGGSDRFFITVKSSILRVGRYNGSTFSAVSGDITGLEDTWIDFVVGVGTTTVDTLVINGVEVSGSNSPDLPGTPAEPLLGSYNGATTASAKYVDRIQRFEVYSTNYTAEQILNDVIPNDLRGDVCSLTEYNFTKMPAVWHDADNGVIAYAAVNSISSSGGFNTYKVTGIPLSFSGAGAVEYPATGGFALPDNALVESIIINWTDLTSPQNVEIGDSSDVDHYAVAFTPALGYQYITLANPISSNNRIVLTPAGAATMTGTMEITYRVLA